MDASNGNHSNNANKPVKCNQNVQVYVRVRPVNSRERLIRSMEVVEVVSTRELHLKSSYTDSRTSKKFTFDRTFAPNSKQHEVYQGVVAPYIEEVLSGFNCTVFAYGQTGTGKTFTMVGEEEPELSAAWEDDTQIGIIPRAVNHLFDELRMTELEFSMRISYLELYNEELCDLLSKDDTVKIRIFDDVQKKGSVIVQGLEEIPVHSKDDVYKLLAKGQERRKTASTLMNAQSSRSHTIFSIIVHIKENGIDGEEMLKIGKLNLVDLAGSENISKAGNEKGIRTRESVNINQSLLTLGRVITALVEKTPHIPYRESKLTRLLQESLGGRTKTSIIATVSPGNKDFEETLSTLEYAHRAKNIQNKPEANQKLSKKTVIKEYTEEIDRLKRDLMAARDKNGIYLAEDTYNEMVYKSEAATKELNDKSALIKALKEDLAKKESIFKEVACSLAEREEELRRTANDLGQTRTELSNTKRSLSKTKRRYVEKKVILQHHLRTEEMLTGQAKELISVVETVTEDTNGLHDTVERRREIDNKNKSASEQFVDRVRDRIRTIQDDVGKMAEECNRLTVTMNVGWESYSQQQEQLHNETKAQLTALETMNQNLLQQNATLVEAFKATLEENMNVGRDDIVRFLAQIEQSRGVLMQSFTGTIEKLMLGIQRTLDTQLEQTRKQFDRMIVHGQTRDTKCAEFCQTFTGQLADLEAITATFESHHTRLQDYVKQSNDEQQKELEAAKEFEQNLKSLLEQQVNGVQRLMQQMTASKRQQSQLTQIVVGVSDELINQGRQAAGQLQAIRGSIEEKTKTVQESTMERDRHVAECDALVQQHQSAVKQELAAVDLSIVDANSQTIVNALEEQRARLSAAQEETQAKLHEFTQSFEAQNDRYGHAQEEGIGLVVGGLQAQQHVRQQYGSTSSDHTQRIGQTIESYERRTKDEQLHELQCEFERFHANDLTFYQPTGKTPIRKKVNYPREIAMASPDERILRRFWRERGMVELDLSTTICEDMEEMHPLDRSDTVKVHEIRNSTPLMQRSSTTNLDEDRQHFKELQISNIASKINSVQMLEESVEENKENGGDIVDRLCTEKGPIIISP
ncbi:kinesin-like protein Klp61F [Anopheles maculipalpis]|uniref:kinesin-like protein Klp61F n=1 Tax=Anopheles maculipalpis TaxID=1496333 RepID=UPI002159A46A|nr:kinesin-like protein Klp61F [Anopheles maculipalpis]